MLEFLSECLGVATSQGLVKITCALVAGLALAAFTVLALITEAE